MENGQIRRHETAHQEGVYQVSTDSGSAKSFVVCVLRVHVFRSPMVECQGA